jgi:hypothetical protein
MITFSLFVSHKHPEEVVYVWGQHSGVNLLAPKMSISPVFEFFVLAYEVKYSTFILVRYIEIDTMITKQNRIYNSFLNENICLLLLLYIFTIIYYFQNVA